MSNETQTSTKAYRCPECRLLVEPVFERDDPISFCCDEICERVWLCAECETNEAHTGCEICFPCLVAAVIEDPRELECCARELQAEIARELANRLRPFLSRRQAA